jgi:hypothetical protein
MPTLFEDSEVFGVGFLTKLIAHEQYLTCDNHPIHGLQACGRSIFSVTLGGSYPMI